MEVAGTWGEMAQRQGTTKTDKSKRKRKRQQIIVKTGRYNQMNQCIQSHESETREVGQKQNREDSPGQQQSTVKTTRPQRGRKEKRRK